MNYRAVLLHGSLTDVADLLEAQQYEGIDDLAAAVLNIARHVALLESQSIEIHPSGTAKRLEQLTNSVAELNN